jgi:TPP-dependent pyruvate/acetoin dehydrogenase alpha subunit
MSLTKEKTLEIYDSICRVRAFEDRLTITQKMGKISGGVYTGRGHEVLTTVAASFLDKQDILGPTHRNMGAHFAKGITYLDMTRQWLGRATGGTRGKDNAAHLGSQEFNIFGIISPLATMIPLVAGATMVNRIRGDNRVALTFVGDGGTSCADFHEGLALISALKLPVVTIIENNGFAFSTAVGSQSKRKNFVDHGKAFNMKSEVFDGTDIEVCYEILDKAFDYVRSGQGPYLLEGKVWRMSGHSLNDDCSYVSEDFKLEADENDPVEKVRLYLIQQGESEDDLEKMRSKWVDEAREVFAQVLTEALPDPASTAEGVFARGMTL